MNEAQTIARVSGLARIVERTFIVRRTTRVALGLGMIAGVVSVAITALAPSLPRAPMLGLPLSCIVAAVLYVRRRVPVRAALVWYVDRRLHADELLLTVYDAASRGQGDPRLVTRAASLVARATARDVRPRRFGRELFALPFVAMLVGVVVVWPRPAPHIGAEPSRVRLATVAELEAVEQLRPIAHVDPEAIARAAREARALRRALEEGMDTRSAVERIDRLREEVAAVRRADTPDQRRAREAAIEALSAERSMADALAARDLAGLSRAVERAASRREAADRARAREALARAARAARNEGDDALAESLLSRERLLGAREQQAALARELAEAMPELGRARMERALETLSRDGDASALDAAMVEAMRDGWQRLSPEERQRLAEAMSRARAAQSELAPSGRSPGERGAPGRPENADDVERQLREALAQLDRLQMRVGASGGLPVPGGVRPGGQRAGNGQSGGQGEGRGQGEGGGGREGRGQGEGSGQGGPSRGGGPGGTPTGATAALEVDPLLARVRPLERAGAPSETFIDWVDPSGTGGTTSAPAPSSAGTAGEANAVTRARVPEAYREHVRTYFGGGD